MNLTKNKLQSLLNSLLSFCGFICTKYRTQWLAQSLRDSEGGAVCGAWVEIVANIYW